MKHLMLVLLVLAIIATSSLSQVANKRPMTSPHRNSIRPILLDYDIPHSPPKTQEVVQLPEWRKILDQAKGMIETEFSKDAAPIIAKAFDAAMKDKNSTEADRKIICSVLMGNIPAKLHYNIEKIYPPFFSLSLEEQKRIFDSVPSDWIFPNTADHGGFLIRIKRYDEGLKLLKTGVMEGEWEKAKSYIIESTFPKEMQISTVKAWEKSARSNHNRFLWLAVLDNYRRMARIDDLQRSFQPALNTIKHHPAELRKLAKMCSDMRWNYALKKIIAIAPSALQPRTDMDALTVFDNTLRAGDRSKVDQTIKLIKSDYPRIYSYLSSYERIQQMYNLGWEDLALNMMEENPRYQDLQMQQLLIYETAFNPDKYRYWMNKFDIEKNRWRGNIVTSAISNKNVIYNEPERAIQMINNGIEYYPDDPTFYRDLMRAYSQAGYTNRVISIAESALSKAYHLEKEIDRKNLSTMIIDELWSATRYTDYYPVAIDRIWELRNRVFESTIVYIAMQMEQDSKFEEALKWLNSRPETRSNAQSVNGERSLYSKESYDIRLRCLLKLGKKDSLDKVLDEAQKRYPDYPFIDHVRDLTGSLESQKQAKIEADKETAKRLADATPPNMGPEDILPYAYMIWAGRLSVMQNNSVDMSQMPEIKPGWREGSQISVDLFKERIDGLVPFVKWVWRMAPEGTYIVNANGNSALKAVLSGFDQMNEKSLGGSFYFASILTAPSLPEADLQDSIGKHAEEWWKNMTSEDRESLLTVLNKEHLNKDSITALKESPIEGLPEWVNRLKGKSAADMAKTGFLTGLVKGIAGFTSSVTGFVGDAFSQAGKAVMNLISGNHDESAPDKSAEAYKLLGKAETSLEKAQALNLLAQTEQDEALDKIEELMPQFLLSIDEGDPPNQLIQAGQAIYTAAKENRDAAKRAAVMIEQITDYSPGTKANLAEYDALVHFWAGENYKGLQSVFHKTFFADIDYADPFAAITCNQVPPEARKLIAVRLESILLEEKPTLSKLTQAILNMERYADIRESSPEGLKLVADILNNYVKIIDTIVPRKFLDKIEMNIYGYSQDKNIPVDVSASWCNLLESAYRKGAQKPGDMEALSMPLKKKFDNYTNDNFRNTEGYQKLKIMLDSLGN